MAVLHKKWQHTYLKKKSNNNNKNLQSSKTHPNNIFSKGIRESQHVRPSSWNPELKDLLHLLDYTLQSAEKNPQNFTILNFKKNHKNSLNGNNFHMIFRKGQIETIACSLLGQQQFPIVWRRIPTP